MNNSNENNNANEQITPTDIFGTKVELTNSKENEDKKDNPIPPPPEKKYTGLYHPELANKQATPEFKQYNPIPNNESVNSPTDINTNKQNIQVNNNESSKDKEEALLQAFIGPNYDKLTTRKFNFAAAFFGYLYMCYRQMVLYGVISIFVLAALSMGISSIVSTLISNNDMALIVSYVIWYGISFLAYGFLTNKIYLYFVKRKIAQIKLNNLNKNHYEIAEMCKRKGGTSIGKLLLAILIPIIFMIIFILISILLLGSMFGAFVTGFKDLNNNIQSSINENVNEADKSFGYTFDETININNEFVITIPSGFENNSKPYSYEYKYVSEDSVFDNCRISMGVPQIKMGIPEVNKEFANAEDLMNEMQDYFKESNSSAVQKMTINNLDWYHVSMDDSTWGGHSFGKLYYYATTKNNKIFLLKYDISENAPSECENYRQQIISSIQSK